MKKFLIFAVIILLAACGSGEKVGRSLDRLTDDTGKALKKAGKATGKAVRKAGQRIDESIE